MTAPALLLPLALYRERADMPTIPRRLPHETDETLNAVKQLMLMKEAIVAAQMYQTVNGGQALPRTAVNIRGGGPIIDCRTGRCILTAEQRREIQFLSRPRRARL